MSIAIRTYDPAKVTYGITDRMRDISRVLYELEKLVPKWRREDMDRKETRRP